MITETAKGSEEIWFLGDGFVAKSGDIIEKKKNTYVAEHFEVRALGSSEITSKIPDPVSRIRNILHTALVRFNCIPKIIVVIPENDMFKGKNSIELKPDEFGISELFGQTIEWVMNEHTDLLDKFKGYLPRKAKKNKYWPFIAWIAPSIHDDYNPEDHKLRRKFTKCLEKIAHGERDVTSLRLMKQIWNQQDNKLLERKGSDHRLSALGWSTMWSAIDNAVKYMDEKIIPNIIEKKSEEKFTTQRNWNRNKRTEVTTITEIHTRELIGMRHKRTQTTSNLGEDTPMKKKKNSGSGANFLHLLSIINVI